MKKFPVIIASFLMFGGCAMPTKQVKVVKSDTPIRVMQLSLDQGDIIACDNNTCKVVTKQ